MSNEAVYRIPQIPQLNIIDQFFSIDKKARQQKKRTFKTLQFFKYTGKYIGSKPNN